MKIHSQRLTKSLIWVVVAGAALGLAQMWLTLFSWDVFVKLMITLVVVGGVVSFIIAVREDLGGDENMKNDKYIN